MIGRVETEYCGLKGWLVLLGFGLIAAPFLNGIGVWEVIGLFADGTVDLISDESSDVYAPGYSNWLKFELVGLALLFLLALYLLSLFFLKSSVFPKAYIGVQIGAVVFSVMDYGISVLVAEGSAEEMQEMIGSQESELEGAIGRASIFALIWILYMVKSKRVKATFVQ